MVGNPFFFLFNCHPSRVQAVFFRMPRKWWFNQCFTKLEKNKQRSPTFPMQNLGNPPAKGCELLVSYMNPKKISTRFSKICRLGYKGLHNSQRFAKSKTCRPDRAPLAAKNGPPSSSHVQVSWPPQHPWPPFDSAPRAKQLGSIALWAGNFWTIFCGRNWTWNLQTSHL